QLSVVGAAQGSESSGRRKPIGESPGIKNIRSGRKNQGPLFHRARPPSRPFGSKGKAKPTTFSSACSKIFAKRAPSSRSFNGDWSGSTFVGRRRSFQR